MDLLSDNLGQPFLKTTHVVYMQNCTLLINNAKPSYADGENLDLGLVPRTGGWHKAEKIMIFIMQQRHWEWILQVQMQNAEAFTLWIGPDRMSYMEQHSCGLILKIVVQPEKDYWL